MKRQLHLDLPATEAAVTKQAIVEVVIGSTGREFQSAKPPKLEASWQESKVDRQWNISIEIPPLLVDRRMGEQTDSDSIPEKEMVASKRKDRPVK
jgi:hypothetical protein